MDKVYQRLNDLRKLELNYSKDINKSKKIGDSVTESILRELYDELLYIPPQKTIIPPRELLEQRYNAIIERAEDRLWGKK